MEWQLGAGIAAINLNLYPGSAEKKNYIFPIPYFTLVTESLEIDRGIRGFLFKSDRVGCAVSIRYALSNLLAFSFLLRCCHRRIPGNSAVAQSLPPRNRLEPGRSHQT